jgi:antitoxin component of MazEF toxin-antitoxin module
MKVRIEHGGSSLVVRIPKHLAHSANLREGDIIELSIKGGAPTITVSTKSCTLDKLVVRTTSENRHHETELGAAWRQ